MYLYIFNVLSGFKIVLLKPNLEIYVLILWQIFKKNWQIFIKLRKIFLFHSTKRQHRIISDHHPPSPNINQHPLWIVAVVVPKKLLKLRKQNIFWNCDKNLISFKLSRGCVKILKFWFFLYFGFFIELKLYYF